MIFIIFIFVLLICVVKVISNKDIIKEHSKTPEDKANIKNARRVFTNVLYANALLIGAVLIALAIVICQYTELDTKIIDYFSTDFYKDDFFNVNFYYLPAFMILTRRIIIEVKISEFLHKYFNVVEEEVNTKDLVKSILYKKKPVTEEKVTEPIPEPEILTTDEQNEKEPK